VKAAGIAAAVEVEELAEVDEAFAAGAVFCPFVLTAGAVFGTTTGVSFHVKSPPAVRCASKSGLGVM
jgi:hypothetical protein